MSIPLNILNIIRNSGMQVSRPVINYWPAQVVASGVISTTPIQYPIGALAVSWSVGSFNLIEIGQLWTVTRGSGSTKRIVSYGVVRKTATSGVLYIDGKSRGDTGIATLQASGITINDTVTVYTVRPLWGLISRINDGTFYKQYDIPYDGSGSNPSPLVNIGEWRQAWSAGDGFANFNFNTNSCFAWDKKTISGRLWAIPAGGSLVSGTTTSSSITVRLPEGFHIIKCRITDSGGAISTGIRPIWVNGDSFLPLSETFGFGIGSDTQNLQGRNQSITIHGDLYNYDILLPGTPFLYTEDAYFNGSNLPNDGILVDTFVGFSNDENITNDLLLGEKKNEIQLQSPWAMFEKIPMVSQAIVEVESPADWTDIGIGLGIPQFIGWYILKHHCNYLSMFDYDFYYDINAWTNEPDNERKFNWGLNGSTLSEYLSQVGKIIAGNIGCRSDGSLTLQRDPNLMDVAYRNNLDVRIELTVDEENGICDIIEPISYAKNYFNQTGQLRLFTMSYNGGGETAVNAFGSIAPGYYQMQAAGSSDEDTIIIKPDNGTAFNFIGYRPSDQLKTNQLCGHVLAKTNSATPEISLSLLRNLDVIDPAEMLWVTLKIPSHWNPRGYSLDTRALVVNIDRSWEDSNGSSIKNVKYTLLLETFGQPGETYIIDKGGGESYAPITTPSENILDPDDESVQDAGILFAINQNGRMGRNKNGKNWKNAIGNITHPINGAPFKFQDIAFNVFSPYVESGYVSGSLGAWVALVRQTTTNGDYNVLSIYYSQDVLKDNIDWKLQYETTSTSDIHEAVRLRSNVNTNNYAACVYYSNEGIWCTKTTDGVQWAKTACGSIVGGGLAGRNKKDIDFVFRNNIILTSGYHAVSGKFKLGYFPSSVSTTWSYVNNSPNSDVPWPCIEGKAVGGFTYATSVIQTTSNTVSSISQNVREVNPQTDSSGFGSRIPFILTSVTGNMLSSNVDISITGDPSNGQNFLDDQTSIVAGYSDANFGNPSQGICYTNPSDFYSFDNGWLINPDYSYPLFLRPFKTHPFNTLKFNVELNLSGDITFDGALMGGRWAFESGTSFPCSTNGLIGLIGSHTCYVETYGKYGILRAIYAITMVTSGNGWSIFAEHPSSVTGSGFSYIQQTVSNLAGADSDKKVRKVILKLRQGVKIESTNRLVAMPLCNAWSLTTNNFTTEEPELYRISNFTAATPTFEIVTPNINVVNKFVPTNPYAISIDSTDDSRIDMVTERLNGGSMYIVQSLESAIGWNIRNGTESFLYGLRLASGDYGLAWGYNRLWVSNDSFDESLIDILGDWHTAIDDGGLFRVLKGVLIPESNI